MGARGPAKGSPRVGGGSRKGRPNKTTAALKDMILTALGNVGGVEYLAKQASDNPAAFMTLLGKVMPLQVAGDGGGPIQIERIERVIVDPSQTSFPTCQIERDSACSR
jgi:hypothetical protein